jgi:hypothetical protein
MQDTPKQPVEMLISGQDDSIPEFLPETRRPNGWRQFFQQGAFAAAGHLASRTALPLECWHCGPNTPPTIADR